MLYIYDASDDAFWYSNRTNVFTSVRMLISVVIPKDVDLANIVVVFIFVILT